MDLVLFNFSAVICTVSISTQVNSSIIKFFIGILNIVRVDVYFFQNSNSETLNKTQYKFYHKIFINILCTVINLIKLLLEKINIHVAI